MEGGGGVAGSHTGLGRWEESWVSGFSTRADGGIIFWEGFTGREAHFAGKGVMMNSILGMTE